MISADFYPTQTTQYTVEYTDIIPNLTYDNPESAAAPYYMGYLNWDDVPSMMHMSKMNVVSEATEAYTEFVDITEAENAPWFFTGRFQSSPYNASGNGMYIVDSTTGKYVKPANNGYFYDFGFFNNLEIQRVASNGNYMIYVSRNIINNTTTPPTYYTSQQETLFTEGGSANISWDYMRQWLNGEAKLYTTNYTVNEVTERFEITPEDLMEGRCEKEFTLTDATLQLFISDYITPYNGRDVQPNNSSAGWSCQNSAVLLHANVDGETKPYITNTTSWHTGYSDERFVYITNYGKGLSHHRIGYTGTIMGGFNGRIPGTFFTNADRSRWYFFGNFAVMRYTSETVRMQRVIPLTEIIKYFSTLFTRIINGSSNIYGFSDSIYYPLFNDDNSPKWEYLNGLQEDIQDELQEWQYTNITANTFTEADIPEYEPPGPEPGPTPQETEPKYTGFPTLGSATRYVPTAGVNFYALNSSLTSTFIQRLWSQPKNFYEAIQIAGNQVDSIFDYIQSFRYYPLNYNFSSSNVYPVIFGTGAVLKDTDGTTNFQLSEATPVQNTVAAGDWNLSDPIYHWRNNFLDYSPYLKMSIYLPFAGTIELSPEAVASHGDITAATITLLASFDIETGTITYYVINQANVLLAQKTAKVAIDLPLSGNNSAEQSAAILRAQFSTVKQMLGAGTSAVMGAATGNMAGVASAAVSTLGSVGDMYLQNSLAQRAVPVEIQGMGGTFSALAGGQYPYITINRQKVSNPPNYAHTTGYLVEGTYKISNLNGLTVCRNVDVSGISQATDTEKAKIKQILESGFYA